MLKLLLLLVLVLVTSLLYAQNAFKGKVINEQTGQPLPFVNIGIISKNVGTVSDIDGIFQIELDDKYDNDSLMFSMIGFTSKFYRIADYKRNFKAGNTIIIPLQARAYKLKEVIVTNKKWKTKIIGNQTTTKSGTVAFAANKLGSEFGIKMRVKKHVKTYLEEFYFSIADNQCDSLYFRLNIYKINGGIPDENLAPENIIIKTNIKSGVLKVDLSKYLISVEDDFIVALEWLRDLCPDIDDGGLSFSGLFGVKSFYVKVTSQGEWFKLPIASVGFWMKIKY